MQSSEDRGFGRTSCGAGRAQGAVTEPPTGALVSRHWDLGRTLSSVVTGQGRAFLSSRRCSRGSARPRGCALRGPAFPTRVTLERARAPSRLREVSLGLRCCVFCFLPSGIASGGSPRQGCWSDGARLWVRSGRCFTRESSRASRGFDADAFGRCCRGTAGLADVTAFLLIFPE